MTAKATQAGRAYVIASSSPPSNAAIRSPVFTRTVMLMLPADPCDALMAEVENLIQASGYSPQRLALVQAHQRVDSLVKQRQITPIQACMLHADFDALASSLAA